MTYDRLSLSYYEEFDEHREVQLGDRRVIKAIGIGNVSCMLSSLDVDGWPEIGIRNGIEKQS